jgi:membrane-associated phospholipid phosphatase
MRLLDLATVAYLALCLAVLVMTRSPGWVALSVVHVVLILLIVRSGRTTSRATHWLRDWYPLLLIPFFYGEIPFLNQTFLSAARDGSIHAFEKALFPSEPARTFATTVAWPVLSEALHMAYLSYYLIIYGPFLILYFTGKREAFEETALAIVLTYYCCYSIYVLAPVRGPWDLVPMSPEAPDGPLRRLTVQILEAGSSVGAAFPSSHQAVAVAQTVCAVRHLPRLAPVITVLTIGIGVGAVYASFHYAVDMIVGAGVGIVIAVSVRWWYQRARSNTITPS